MHFGIFAGKVQHSLIEYGFSPFNIKQANVMRHKVTTKYNCNYPKRVFFCHEINICVIIIH